MKFTAPDGRVEEVEFASDGSLVSRWVAADILKGKTYPYLPFVDDVRVMFDVGANCGATTMFFARHYPDAVVHSFEPARETRVYLERNVASLPNVRVHPFALYSEDGEAPLYHAEDSGSASLLARSVNVDDSETVQLRAAGPWTEEHDIDRIDVLKVDVEGVEIEVLESLAALLPTVKVAYVEYDSRQARRALARMFDPTHEFYVGSMFMDQGELIYLRQDYAEREEASRKLEEMFRTRLAEQLGTGAG